MQAEETRRFQLAHDRWAILLVRHSRMERRQSGQCDGENKDRVHHSNERAEPPCRFSQELKCRDIDQRKSPAVYEMEKDADEFRAIAIGSKDGAKEIWHVHPRHSDSLTAGKNGGEDDRAGEAPE
jgi:hypothetical protein